MARNNNRYSLLAEFPSESNPDKTYKVSHDNSNGIYTCSCPRWIFKRENLPDGHCKHIKAFLESGGKIPVAFRNPKLKLKAETAQIEELYSSVFQNN